MTGIICTGKQNPQDYETKCTAIAHSIISAGRPRSFKSPIMLGTSIYLHRQFSSKAAVQLFSKLGFCASFDETRVYENSIISGNEDRILDKSFSQYVFDNADFNSITLDGHHTLHVMGGIRIVTPHDSVLKQQPMNRLKEKLKAEEIAALSTIPIQVVTSNPETGLKNVVIRNIDSQMDYTELTAEQLSLYDATWLWAKVKDIEIGGWNGFLERVTSSMLCEKSTVLFLPFIDLPAHNHDCIKTALSYALEKSREVGQKITFVTFDLPLYLKASDIVRSEPEMENIVVRLGGFHLLMSFLGCIGYLMMGSGLEEAFCLIYAPLSVTKILSGHAYARTVRAHSLMLVALAKKIFTNMENLDLDDDEIVNLVLNGKLEDFIDSASLERLKSVMQNKLSECKLRGPTAKLWVQYFNLITIAKNFIRAERMSDWNLHLQCVCNMIPYFYAAGHFQYAKGAQLYLQDMVALYEKMSPEEFSLFTSGGYFSVRRTDKPFSGTWSDMIIEQSLMRSMKVTSGITHGRGISESVRSQWILGSRTSSLICSQLEEYCGTRSTTNEQHVDWRDARRKRDDADIQKLYEWLLNHDPFSDRKEVVSLSTGLIGNGVNCYDAYEIGKSIMSENENKRFTDIKMKMSKKATTLGTMKNTVLIKKKSYTLDPLTLFHRICVLQEESSDLKSYLSYELAPYPLALFNEVGMRKNTKSELYAVFRDSQPMDVHNYHYVVDGGYLLHKVVWPPQQTFGNLLSIYLEYVKKHFGQNVSVIFDGYEKACLKDAERRRRYTATAPDIVIDKNTPVTTKQQLFLANSRNKGSFVDLLRQHFMDNGVNARTAAHDADIEIVKEAVQLQEAGLHTAVVGEDVDLLILITALASDEGQPILFVKPGKSKADQKIFSSKVNENFKATALFLHAFTGCDTTSALYRKGKKTSWETLSNAPELHEIVNIFHAEHSTKNEIGKYGCEAMKILYKVRGIREDMSLNCLRYTQFRTLAVKNKVDLPSLPPTEAATIQHAYRVYIQIQEWLGRELNIHEWGWKEDESGFYPVTTDAPPAPSVLMKKLFCACKKTCGNRCGCRALGPK